ncbi:hypothetical protein ABZ845_10590 [Streptomyces sp. NPDC047022]|uniref:hypothetical protein n=1 Tax=Streptomyces sp. NPDC047022 TaxID=3155737 RepID=UPI0033CA9A46
MCGRSTSAQIAETIASTKAATPDSTVWILIAAALALAVLALIVALLRSRKQGDLTEEVRSMAGLLAVWGSDGVIVAAAIFGIKLVKSDSNQAVALLTSAFTAVTAITTAYFGIKAVSNTAQSVVAQQALGNVNGDGEKGREGRQQGNPGPGQAGQPGQDRMRGSPPPDR